MLVSVTLMSSYSLSTRGFPPDVYRKLNVCGTEVTVVSLVYNI